jgi:hypothetical protein
MFGVQRSAFGVRCSAFSIVMWSVVRTSQQVE